ncbi:MAG: hypothetical protein C4297_14210 [Gemmataceae bacterium]
MSRGLVLAGSVLLAVCNALGDPPVSKPKPQGHIQAPGVFFSSPNLTVGIAGGRPVELGWCSPWWCTCWMSPFIPMPTPIVIVTGRGGVNDPAAVLRAGPSGIGPNVPPRGEGERPAERIGAPKAKEKEKAKDELEVKAEAQKLLRQGNDAFAAGQYALAAKRYEAARQKAPREALLHFHAAQAYFALDRPGDAVVAIQRGLQLHPQWPEAGFEPRALYRDRADEFARHLARLAERVQKNRNDDSLLFLLGYQLWFDGRREEAVTLFNRAAALNPDRTFVVPFLEAHQRKNAAAQGKGP